MVEGSGCGVAKSLQAVGSSARREKRIKGILRELQAYRGDFDLGFLSERPDDRLYHWLLSLPHVGPKIAHCVMLYSLGRDVLPVDTHVHRILKRLGLVLPSTKPEDAGDEIQTDVPAGSAYRLHVNLVMHGRQKCKAYAPKCEECEIESFCAYAGHHVVDSV